MLPSREYNFDYVGKVSSQKIAPVDERKNKELYYLFIHNIMCNDFKVVINLYFCPYEYYL